MGQGTKSRIPFSLLQGLIILVIYPQSHCVMEDIRIGFVGVVKKKLKGGGQRLAGSQMKK